MLHQIFKCDMVSKIATSSNLRRRVTIILQYINFAFELILIFKHIFLEFILANNNNNLLKAID